MIEKIALKTPDGTIINPQLIGESKLPTGGLTTLQSVIKWGSTVLLITAVILALFFLIWGGISWITSGGDKEKLAGARKKITYAIIGLIITISAFMIVSIVGYLFGVEFF